MKKLPNILTTARLILVPIFGYYLYMKCYEIATLLYLIGGLTDILDGYLARKFNSITAWGKVADPLADKLLQFVAILMLTIHGFVPVPIIVVVFCKEICMAIGTLLLYKNINIVVPSTWYGKAATVLFYIPIFLSIFIRYYEIQNSYIDQSIMIMYWLAVIASIYAIVMYSINYIKVSKASKS